MMYVRYFLFFGLTVLVGCSSQTSDDESNVSSTAPAILQISPAPFDYDYVAENATSSSLFTLTNVGGFNASTFSHVGNSGPFSFTGTDFPGNGGNCGITLAPGASCLIEIEFAPTSLDTFNESFDLQYLDGEVNQVVSVNLSGLSIIDAIPPALLTLKDPATSPGSDPTPEITVSGGDISNGQIVRLYTDNTCTTLVATGTATGTSIDLTSSALTDGSYNFYATTTNNFASTSVCSTATVNYVLDLTNPNPQTIITHASTHDDASTSPAISWTLSNSADVTAQSIGLSANAAGGNDIAGFIPLNNTLNNYTFTDLSLNECTNYYATLFATDHVGNQSVHAVSTTPFQVDGTNPSDPSGISLTGVPTFIKAKTFNFIGSTDACGIASYEMAIGTASTGAGINNTMNWLDVGTPTGSYTLESGVAGASFNLFRSQNYYISIRAKDAFGNYSNPITSPSFTVDPTFNLTLAQAYPDQVDLTWTAPLTTGVTDYDIYYKLSTATSYNLFADGVSATRSTTVTGLNPTSSYDFYVDAKRGTIKVEYSDTLTSSTIDVPIAPTSLVLKNPLTSPSNDDTPEVTVSGGDIAAGFIVGLYTDNTCTVQIATGTATSGSIDLTASPVLAEGVYTFYSKLTDTFGYSSACSTASLNYEVDLTNPEPPTNITHLAQHNDVTTSPSISWTLSTSTDIASQQIGLSTASVGGNEAAGFINLTSTDTTYDFTGLSLTECTDYYATVFAEDASGNISVHGVSATPFKIDSTSPTPASSLTLSGSPTFIKAPTLNFTDATDACGAIAYEIAIGTTGSGAGVNDTMDWLNVGAQTSSYTLENGIDSATFNLIYGQDYFLSIRAIDGVGLTSTVATSPVFVINPTFTLAADSFDETSIDISWTTPLTSGVTDYDVFYKLSSDPNYTLFNDGASTTLSTTVTGLTPGTSYELFVISKVGTTNVEYSNTITQITNTAVEPIASLVLKDPTFSPNSDTTPQVTINFSQTSTGAPVNLYSDNTCTTLVSNNWAPNGTTSIDLQVFSPLAIGTYDFHATFNNGSCSTATVAYEVIPVFIAPPSALTLFNPSTSPNLDTTPEITVTISPTTTGGQVVLYSDSACTITVSNAWAPAGTTSANLTVFSPLADGEHTFYATASDTTGAVSACSTASVTYEVGEETIEPPTNITHLNLHDDITTSPAISWTLSTSPNVNEQFIGLSTLPAGGNDVAGYETLTATDTTYTFSGQSLAECTDYYATVYAENAAGTSSTLEISATPFQVDANNPTDLAGISLSGNATLIATPTLNWTSESTDTCGVSHYEIALGTTNTGTGVNNVIDYTDIGNPTGNYTVTDGVDGISLSLASGTDYYLSVRAVDINGNFSNTVTSAAFTLDPTFILGLDSRLHDSLTLSWNLPTNTPGITDYDILYKETSASTYTQFVDGISTARNIELTGLTPETTYDIYIVAKVGTNDVEISNVITEATGPDLPFFTANYAAANVGGATGCRVIAYDGGGTEIHRNGTLLTNLANAGDVYDFACAQHDLLESDKPFYVNGVRGSANISWASKGFSAKDYVFDFSRSSPLRVHIFAFEDSTVQLLRGSTVIETLNLTANTGTASPIQTTTLGSYKIESTGLIIAFVDGNSNSDPRVLAPATQEIIGFPSNSARFGVLGTGVSVTSALGTGTPTTNLYDEGTAYNFGSTGSLYSGSAQKFTAAPGERIAANSYADSNGSCAASFASTSKFFKRYIIPGNSGWAAVAATEAMSIEVVEASSGNVVNTVALTGSAANGVFYHRFENLAEGHIFRATDPTKRFAMWWEPNGTTAYMSNDDESIMWGSND